MNNTDQTWDVPNLQKKILLVKRICPQLNLPNVRKKMLRTCIELLNRDKPKQCTFGICHELRYQIMTAVHQKHHYTVPELHGIVTTSVIHTIFKMNLSDAMEFDTIDDATTYSYWWEINDIDNRIEYLYFLIDKQ